MRLTWVDREFPEFKAKHVPGGVWVGCRTCYRVTRGAFRRPSEVVPDIRAVRPWIEAHEHTPFLTERQAHAEQVRMAVERDR